MDWRHAPRHGIVGKLEPKLKIIWDITLNDIATVKAFLAPLEGKRFVKGRIAKNVTGPKPVFSKDLFWHRMIACLLTTQQKSGPKSAITRLILEQPFPLTYQTCCATDRLETLVRDVLSQAGGIRRSSRIAVEVSENHKRLESGFWADVETAWGLLAVADDPAEERKAARMIDNELKGFGPKQARNLLQVLGLTKYEIPIDSRITKWLQKNNFPLHLTTQALSCPEVYELILDGVQELCRKCDVYPCVLDAAIFASSDGDGWDDVEGIW